VAVNIEKARRQIRALLELGRDDGATEAEAENALRFARRLMLAHSVEESDLAPVDGHERAADEEYAQTDALLDSDKGARWEGHLAQVIARLVGSVHVYAGHGVQARTAGGALLFDGMGRTRTVKRYVFYGPKSDTETARDLFGEWRVTIAALARMHYGGVYRGPGRSYAEGFARGLDDKLRKAEVEERDLLRAHEADALTSGSDRNTALVLVRALPALRAKREKASTWLRNECGIRLGRSGGGRGGRHHGDAHGHGRRDGAAANLSGSSQRRLA
jgi:hypothetical protein